MQAQNTNSNKNSSYFPVISYSEELKGRSNIKISPVLQAYRLERDALSKNTKYININNNINNINIQNKNNNEIKNSNNGENKQLLFGNESPIEKNNSFHDLLDINSNSQKESIKELEKNNINQELPYNKDNKIDNLIQAITKNSEITGKLLESIDKTYYPLLLQSINNQQATLNLLMDSNKKQEETISLLTILVQKLVKDKDEAEGKNSNDDNKKKEN